MLAIGCGATGRGTAPPDECRGREAFFLTDEMVDQMSDDDLARVVAHNENLQRECGVLPPNPSGQAKAKAAVKKRGERG